MAGDRGCNAGAHRRRIQERHASAGILTLLLCSACGGGDSGTTPRGDNSEVFGDGSIVATPECSDPGASAPVPAPVFVRNLKSNTGWFSSPAFVDLSDGTTTTRALVVPSYDIHVYGADGTLLSHVPEGGATSGRIYAPAPIADIDGDGRTDIVVGGSDGTAA